MSILCAESSELTERQEMEILSTSNTEGMVSVTCVAKRADPVDPIIIEDSDIPIQCSPPAKASDATCVSGNCSSPMQQDSAQSKKGTGRKRAAFPANQPNRRGQAKKSTSLDGGEQSNLIDSFLSPAAPPTKKAKTKLNVEECQVITVDSAAAQPPPALNDSEGISVPTKSDHSPSPEKEEIDSGSAVQAKPEGENKKMAGRQKAVAKVINTPETCADGSAVETPMTKSINSKSSNKSKDSLSAEEREKRERLIRSELVSVSEMRIYGDYIPMLRPTSEDLQELTDFMETDGPVPIKVRQLLSRFIEGRDQETGDIIECLKTIIRSGEEETSKTVDFSRIPSILADIAEPLDCRPKLPPGNDVTDVSFIRRTTVKDMADFPEKFRSMVDVHRKMESALKERMIHLFEMMKELNGSGKGLGKLERSLVSMKDRYAKLEEREKKEKEKLEIKLDADRKKMEEALKKQEEHRKKQEELRKRQEEKEEKSKKKEEEVRVKDKKDQGKQKEAIVSKQASFMANFFKKPTATYQAESSQSANHEDASDVSGVEQFEKHDALNVTRCEKDRDIAVKVHRNFHPWEKPKNAIVAGFPHGPSNVHNDHLDQDIPAPNGTDLQSWIAHWKKNPRKNQPQQIALRENGSPHPRMKMLQLCMMVPVAKTQLVDVDIDASKKVIWDVEADPEEKQLQSILCEAEPISDGLFRWKDKTLQFLTEGGGWFDSRRPPYFGTWSKSSQLVTGRRPLAREPELDYDYESDADWESEAGDGEDLGSEVENEDEGDDDMDADEDGGFVVPDGYSSDRDLPEGGIMESRPATKLQQIVYDHRGLPAELASEFSARILDDLPLILCNDPNIVMQKDTDFFGDDIMSCKMPSLEAALFRFHQHPTACSFTYILPTCIESKFAGFLFLKTANASSNASKQAGMISGFLKTVPDSKRAAIQAAQDRTNAQASKEVHMAQAQNVTEGTAGPTAKPTVQPPVQVTEDQVKQLLKLVQGSKKSKVELVEDYVSSCPGLSKNRAFKIFSQVICKRNCRWAISDEALGKYPMLADIAAELWKANSSNPHTAVDPQSQESPPKAPLQQQLIFRPTPKPSLLVPQNQVPSNSVNVQVVNHMDSEMLGQFGCLPV